MEALIRGMRAYASEQVEASRARLIANLTSATGGRTPLVLDVALPGAAYFSVAAGGLAEVLHLLGEDRVRVDRFLGASGGACSLFLILANQRDPTSVAGLPGSRCPSSELLLRSYLEYGESEGSGSLSRTFHAMLQSVAGVSAFWERKYRELLRDASAFQAIQERAFVAVACKPIRRQALGMKPRQVPRRCLGATPAAARAGAAEEEEEEEEDFEAASDNYLFHDFETEEQAVQAMVATGEATAKGVFAGVHVLAHAESRAFALPEGGAEAGGRRVRLPASFCDGGHPVAPQPLPPASTAGSASPALPDRSANALLYYHTFFEGASDALFCTPESVERLFRRGVDRTIECLCSPSLAAPEPSPSGASPQQLPPDKMVVALPGAALPPALGMIGRERDLAGGAFVSLRGRRVVEVGSP